MDNETVKLLGGSLTLTQLNAIFQTIPEEFDLLMNTTLFAGLRQISTASSSGLTTISASTS